MIPMGRMTHRLLARPATAGISVYLVLSLVAAPPMALADSLADPFASDPLGLISHYGLTTQVPLTADTLEVWVCEKVGGGLPISDLTPEQLVGAAEDAVSEYWNLESAGAYRVSLRSGGTVEVEAADADCASAVIKQVGDDVGATLIFEKNSHQDTWGGGSGTPGIYCYTETEIIPCPGMPPAKSRFALVVMGGESDSVPIDTIIHEIGHVLSFPHSFTGSLSPTDPHYQYDNPMDIMSGGGDPTNLLGTAAPNRYAAGWISPEKVHVHVNGVSRLALSANRRAGTQMAAVLSVEQGVWLSLGARLPSRFERVPKGGVEAYVVNQSSRACNADISNQGGCWGVGRRTTTHPSASGGEIPHVLDKGDSLVWNGVSVRVAGRLGERFLVEITGETGSEPPDKVVDSGNGGSFVDDDSSPHEADIDLVADLGVTAGCEPPPAASFCPERLVTRAEMAAFLVRSLGGDALDVPVSEHTFGDVPEDRWYAPYVKAVAAMGIDRGVDGMWMPDKALTRLEMARWLTAAFDHIRPAAQPEGAFGDVPPEGQAVTEGLLEAEVTRGCSVDPLRFCPDDPVTRAQMASFLVRALFAEGNSS